MSTQYFTKIKSQSDDQLSYFRRHSFLNIPGTGAPDENTRQYRLVTNQEMYLAALHIDVKGGGDFNVSAYKEIKDDSGSVVHTVFIIPQSAQTDSYENDEVKKFITVEGELIIEVENTSGSDKDVYLMVQAFSGGEPHFRKK